MQVRAAVSVDGNVRRQFTQFPASQL